MAAGEYLVPWVRDALRALGGSGTIVDVCKVIWREHERDLRASGDSFYTWQYDVRWAAYSLREAGEARRVEDAPRGVWELVSGSATSRSI